jgi:hypothetical protein
MAEKNCATFIPKRASDPSCCYFLFWLVESGAARLFKPALRRGTAQFQTRPITPCGKILLKCMVLPYAYLLGRNNSNLRLLKWSLTFHRLHVKIRPYLVRQGKMKISRHVTYAGLVNKGYGPRGPGTCVSVTGSSWRI